MHKVFLLLFVILLSPKLFADEISYEQIDPETSYGERFIDLIESKRLKADLNRYHRINEYLFMFQFSGVLIESGIYLADIKNQKVERAIGGFAEILRFKYIENKKIIFLSKSGGLRRGKGWRSYSSTVCGLSLNCKRENILTMYYDGETGGCGRGIEIGISKATIINSVSVKDNLISIDYIEEECETGKKVKKHIAKELP